MKKTHIIILLGFLLNSCAKEIKQTESYMADESFPIISIENLDAKYYTGHLVQTTVKAPVMDRYETFDRQIMEFPKGVRVVFVDSLMNEKSFLEADYATYNQKKRLWEARKNVVFTNNDGMMLKTEQLFGDEQKDKVFSVKKVTIIEPDGSQIVGKQGFESNTSFTDYKFLDVNGVVQISQMYKEEVSDEK